VNKYFDFQNIKILNPNVIEKNLTNIPKDSSRLI